jgi:acyl-[acyl-carrier-protein]-phospholipid O-acyltransferase/long-chain-fatty-acid--[acyl-carrier-protein] ligase
MKLIHKQFIEVAKKYPQKIAVYDQTLAADYSFQKILIAALIFQKKIEKYSDKHIGVMVPTSAGAFISILAILFSGKIPVIINYATGATQNSIYTQNKVGCEVIITSRNLLKRLEQKSVAGMVFLEDLKSKISAWDKFKGAVRSKLGRRSLLKTIHLGKLLDTAVIIFTSGSEKEPKAVQLSHKNIAHQLQIFPKMFKLTPHDIFLGNLPIFHIFGFTLFWLALNSAASVVTHANPLDYSKVAASIKKYAITFVFGTPTFLFGYLKKSEKGDFESIRYLIAGADKVHEHLRQGYLQKHNLEILEGYGTTETSPVITSNTLNNNRPGSVGKIIEGMQLKIVDCDTEAELPRGEMGKILVKGDSVMKGYFNDLEETTLRLKDGWYETGDMGILDEDGFLWHQGRLKRFVKVGGEMVSLIRVEDELDRLVPQDVVVCVVDVPDPKKGAEIVAAITTAAIDKRKIRKQLSQNLPSIAIPKEFYVIEDIPMMGNGKVNFKEVEIICRNIKAKKQRKK